MQFNDILTTPNDKSNKKMTLGGRFTKKHFMPNRQLSTQYEMQTEVNYDLLSRSDSMKRMTIKNLDNEFGLATGDIDDTNKLNHIQKKMQNKRSRKLEQQSSSC